MKFLIILFAIAVLAFIIIYFFLSPQLRLGVSDLLSQKPTNATSSLPITTPSQAPLNQTPPGFIGPNSSPHIIGPPGPPPNY